MKLKLNSVYTTKMSRQLINIQTNYPKYPPRKMVGKFVFAMVTLHIPKTNSNPILQYEPILPENHHEKHHLPHLPSQHHHHQNGVTFSQYCPPPHFHSQTLLHHTPPPCVSETLPSCHHLHLCDQNHKKIIQREILIPCVGRLKLN